eukprot:3805703-Amphidinium_carterae.1
MQSRPGTSSNKAGPKKKAGGFKLDWRPDGRYTRSDGEEVCFTWNRQKDGCKEPCPHRRAHKCEWRLEVGAGLDVPEASESASACSGPGHSSRDGLDYDRCYGGEVVVRDGRSMEVEMPDAVLIGDVVPSVLTRAQQNLSLSGRQLREMENEECRAGLRNAAKSTLGRPHLHRVMQQVRLCLHVARRRHAEASGLVDCFGADPAKLPPTMNEPW